MSRSYMKLQLTLFIRIVSYNVKFPSKENITTSKTIKNLLPKAIKIQDPIQGP